MDPRLKVTLFLTALAAAVLAFCGLMKWMERKGWVNLRSGGGRGVGAGVGALQEIYDPPARHVFEVREQGPRKSESGGPPGPDAGG